MSAAASFIKLAREDLAVAQKLADDHPRHAAFCIEQAAEKLLKAVLTVEKIRFSTQHHQLGNLAQQLPVDHPWRADLVEFDSFTSFATALRYPTPGGEMPSDPSPGTVADGLFKLRNLIDEIADWCAEREEQARRQRRD